MQNNLNNVHIQGNVLIIGYGSIGQGVLPLIQRHFTYDKMTIIDPKEDGPNDPNIEFLKLAVTAENYKDLIDQIFKGVKGFCVNLSVGTSSRQIMNYCQSKGILYIDTVVEEWEGFYSNDKLTPKQRSNYALRESMLKLCRNNGHKTTAISCCGANPGMVSWFVKQALVNLANDMGVDFQVPKSKEEWAKLMMKLGVQGVHIAERDTQVSSRVKKPKEFFNTWSVDGFIGEGYYQPAELGFGTHEKWMPKDAQQHEEGCKAGIVLGTTGMRTKVKSWCPTLGPQFGYLVTHNQAISVSDYFSVKENGNVIYRPTCHYAYHPCEDAVKSCVQCVETGFVPGQQNWTILKEQITDGMDELGVLLYGHAKNAYWYGSQLSIHDTRKRAPKQNATALQVTSAIVAGMIWALENPCEGVVQTEDMDYKKCLEIQQPYISPVRGYYTDWTPLKGIDKHDSVDDSKNEEDAWQFENVLISDK